MVPLVKLALTDLKNELKIQKKTHHCYTAMNVLLMLMVQIDIYAVVELKEMLQCNSTPVMHYVFVRLRWSHTKKIAFISHKEKFLSYLIIDSDWSVLCDMFQIISHLADCCDLWRFWRELLSLLSLLLNMSTRLKYVYIIWSSTRAYSNWWQPSVRTRSFHGTSSIFWKLRLAITMGKRVSR